MAVYDDGRGDALYVGGGISEAGGREVSNGIARWDGSGWSALPPRQGEQDGGTVTAFAVAGNNGRQILYVNGVGPPEEESSSEGRAGIASFDGAEWRVFRLPGGVDSLAVFNDGQGDTVYAATGYYDPGFGITSWIVRLDGDEWTEIEESRVGHFFQAWATMVVGVVAGREMLFVGGPNIAQYDGTTWTWFPEITGDPEEVYGQTYAMTIFDDGSAPALFVSGTFATAGDVPAANIAQWQCPSPGSLRRTPGGRNQ